MAKVNVAADNIRVQAISSIDENRAILRVIQAKKEVDARKQDELNVLFDGINAECASRSLKEKEKALTSSDKIESTSKPVHYGPLPGYPPGKWWGIRMDCSRDCVHEPFNENIHDGPYGAVSICTSHLNVHNDVDLGNILTYTNTEYNPANKSKDSLILSYKNRVPIRLVRSCSLSNKYAPKTGYRYDGLYTVVHHWIGVSADATKHHKFVLTRVINQEPPSWVDEKRGGRAARLKKSCSILTRSSQHSNASECKAIQFIYNKVEKKSKPSSVSAIVSRQVFDKCTASAPDNWFSDSTNQQNSLSASSTKLCSTNLSIRTNLYDSSHQAQQVKKPSVCKIFKPNQFIQLSQATFKDLKQLPAGTKPKVETSTIIDQQAVKKVTWADASTEGLMDKSIPAAGNGFQYNSSDLVVDGFRSCKRSRVMKYNNTSDYSPSNKMAKRKNAINSKGADQSHSIATLSQNSKALQHEAEMKTSESLSIDSLAPDKLVSVIVKEKCHPMAKLLMGNMIGLENQEEAIVTAYNALTKVGQDDSKQSKENKLRNKFSIKSPAKKNGILKKPRREVANLKIDAKFDTRSSRSRGLVGTSSIRKTDSTRRKLLNSRRIPSRDKAIANSRETNSKRPIKEIKVQETKKMSTVWTQCSLPAAPAVVDRCQQTDESCFACMKVEPIEIVDSTKAASSTYSKSKEDLVYPRSAFAAVSAGGSDGIARLRSIGFRPIGCGDPPVAQDPESGPDESPRPDVKRQYNKYTSEENDVVGYMDEQLHFEDIEEEEMAIAEDTQDPESGPDESPRPVVKQEYNKYTSEENDVVGYMDEQVHFEDIKEEKMAIAEDTVNIQLERATNILPQPIETLTEHDFNKPWHGWRQISINGQSYWTACW